MGVGHVQVSVCEAPAASPVTVWVWLLIPSGVSFTTKVPVPALPWFLMTEETVTVVPAV